MRTFRLLIAALALVALVAACNGTQASDDDDTTDQTDTGTDVDDDTDSGTDGDDTDSGTDGDDADDEADDDVAAGDDTEAPAPAQPAANPEPTPAEPAPAKPAPVEPAPAPAPAPAPTSAPALADGAHQGRLTDITATTVTLELVRMLSGAEAIAAAERAGVDVSEGLPNDYFIEDVGRTVTMPIAGDAGLRIYDCSSQCQEVGTTLDALVSGSAKPFNGSNAPFSVRVEAGSVVSLAEIYVP